MEEKIKLNQQGYDEYLKQLEEVEKELAELRLYKGKVAIYQGDNWHDNPTLYQTELKEMALMKRVNELKYKLKNGIELVESSNDESLIDIGDIVRIDMIFAEDDIEEELLKLIATTPSVDRRAEIKEVSINSPIGASIYHKKVGDTASYKVNDRVFNLKIKEKIMENEIKKLTK